MRDRGESIILAIDSIPTMVFETTTKKMSHRFYTRRFLNYILCVLLTIVCLNVDSMPGSSSSLHNSTLSPLICSDGEFACVDGSLCYAAADRCDNIPDCDDKSDETNCDGSSRCSDAEFYCASDDECFPNVYRCDGNKDCADGSDENSCADRKCSVADEFMCVSDKKCIVGQLRCDAINHCHDGSDEIGCDDDHDDDHQSCDSELTFDCYGDGRTCISLHKKCDEHNDCENGEDEAADLCASSNSSVTRSRCALNNGGCSHDCVTTSHGYHCDCPEGYELGSDHLTCEDIDECEHHACSHDCENDEGGYHCLCQEGYKFADDEHTCLVDGHEPEIWITNGSMLIQYGLHSGDERITSLGGLVQSVTYSYNNGTYFWIDASRKSIYRSNIDISGSPSEVLVNSLISTPVALAYDWIHDNLYWADAGHQSKNARIEVLTFPHLWRTVVLTSDAVDSPRFLVVDPRNGYGFLYWTQAGDTPRIRKSGLDGSEPFDFVDADIEHPSGLAIDFVDDRLFWIDSKLNILVSVSLHDHDQEVIATFTEYPRHPVGLAVFEDWVYWADEETKSVYKLYKFRREGETEMSTVLDQLAIPRSVEMYHKFKQPLDESYCGDDNGGCSHICLPSPHFIRYRCVCPLSMDKTKHYILTDENKKTCELTDIHSMEKPNFIHPKSGISIDKTRPHSTTNDGDESSSKRPSSGGSEEIKKESDEGDNKMWIWIGIGGGVGLVVVALLSLIGYKLYARHVAKNLHFDNPVFEQKPLKSMDGQGDSAA